MPSYDFLCRDCGEPYEVRLSMSAYSAGEGRVCTACGSDNVERTLSAAFVVSGGGSHRSSGCSPSSGFT
ncbi:MAG: zinc ribbon domain-containing protein [Gemmatimonadota bacterium]|nr:zinc ribbon domain-containing protein [Gemmatimonadota bacterium]